MISFNFSATNTKHFKNNKQLLYAFILKDLYFGQITLGDLVVLSEQPMPLTSLPLSNQLTGHVF